MIELILVSAAARVKFRVTHIEVFAVKFILNHAQAFPETLEMNDFTLTQETNRVANLRVLD